MWGYPGKKLLFMGQEFAQRDEWSEARALDWHLLDFAAAPRGAAAGARPQLPLPRRVRRCMRATASREGFSWLIVDDSQNSVFAWLRKAPGGNPVAVISNFTPVPRDNYRVPLPKPGPGARSSTPTRPSMAARAWAMAARVEARGG